PPRRLDGRRLPRGAAAGATRRAGGARRLERPPARRVRARLGRHAPRRHARARRPRRLGQRVALAERDAAPVPAAVDQQQWQPTTGECCRAFELEGSPVWAELLLHREKVLRLGGLAGPDDLRLLLAD